MMQAHIERHRDPENAKTRTPLLALMPETYGVMVYQEDVIKVAHRFAGSTSARPTSCMSGKFRSRDEFDRARDAFHTKAVAKGHPVHVVRGVAPNGKLQGTPSPRGTPPPAPSKVTRACSSRCTTS